MKPLSQIRNPNAVVTEDKLDSAETTKLQQLVRVGFVDKEDLQRLKRALNKETTNLTRPEKDLLTGVFHKLLDHVLNNQQLFQKTKQSYGTSKSVDIKWSGTHTLPQAEDLSIDEAVDVSAEYGYQPGDYHSHVHAMLNTKGLRESEMIIIPMK